MNLDAALLRTILPTDLGRIHAEHGAGTLTEADLNEKYARAGDLYTALNTFQPRLSWETPWVVDAHIRDLMKAAKQRGKEGLAPIIVFPIDGLRVVIDGHCRLFAYLMNEEAEDTVVPVEHFRGTFHEALLAASASNAQDKLSLTKAAKAEMAWRIVVYEEGQRIQSSLRAIERATGCSKSVVGIMRKCLKRYPKLAQEQEIEVETAVAKADGTCPPHYLDPRKNGWLNAKNMGRTARSAVKRIGRSYR